MSAGFEPYNVIMTKREERRQAEMNRGAKQVKTDMAQGLVDKLAIELDPKRKFSFHMVAYGDDARKWGVRVDFNNGQAHSENFWDFPTDELRAKIMLFGG